MTRAVGLRGRPRARAARPRALRDAGRARPRGRRAGGGAARCCARRWRCSAARRWPTRRCSARPRPRPTGSRSCGWPRSSERIDADLALGARTRRWSPSCEALIAEHPYRERLPRAADARPVPLRPPGRRARRVPPRAAHAGRGARARPGPRAAAARGGDPGPGSGARPAAAAPPPPRAVPAPPPLPAPADAAARPRRTTSTPRRRCSPTGRRLLTLTGPGGIGKTRLALELAHRLGGPFADGARFVSLGALDDPERACPRSPGARARVDRPRETSPGAMLLVVDNFEQVLDAAAGAQRAARGVAGLEADRHEPRAAADRGRARARARRRSRPSRRVAAVPAPRARRRPPARARARRRATGSSSICDAARRAPARDRARRGAHQGALAAGDPRPARAAGSTCSPAGPRDAPGAPADAAGGDRLELRPARRRRRRRLFARARRVRRRLHAARPPKPSAARTRSTASPRWPTRASSPATAAASACSRPSASTRSSSSTGGPDDVRRRHARAFAALPTSAEDGMRGPSQPDWFGAARRRPRQHPRGHRATRSPTATANGAALAGGLCALLGRRADADRAPRAARDGARGGRGKPGAAGHALNAAGRDGRRAGRLRRRARHFNAALELARAVGDRARIARLQSNLARSPCTPGDHEAGDPPLRGGAP